MTSVYCIYRASAVDPAQIKMKYLVLAFHSVRSSSCLMVAMLRTLLQIKLEAVANILIVLSFKFAQLGSLVDANALSVIQS